MGTIPLPALAVRPPEQQPGVLDQYSKIIGLRGMQAQQQTQALQQQGLEQENQMRALQLKDQQALRTLSPQFVKKDDSGKVTGYDFDGFLKGAAGAGVSPQTLSQMQLQRAESVKALAGADEATRANEIAKNKAMYEGIESLRAIKDPAQRSAALQQLLPNLQKQGVDTSKIPPNAPLDDNALTNYEAGLGMHAQSLTDAKTVAETNKANEQANLAKMEAQEKGSPLIKMQNDPTMFAGDKLPASIGYLQSKINDPQATPLEKTTAQRLMVTAQTAKKTQLAMEASKKAMEQSIADGDPRAAAQLLVSGVVAPSQLISSRKPEFAQKAFTAAQELQQGWNAQKADADFKVASSPANVGFFGSAKSLTDKGGTLDQLAAAAKDIPQGQFPVFNSFADAAQAALGKGPIAKYSSLLVGVADDYSKVMGGGTGSDASRNQGITLVPAKASPEARDAAIEGIRGAVTSQINSRIGNNTVLRKMYGVEGPESSKIGPNANGGKFTLALPNGKTASFPTQEALDAFKKEAKL